jgi:antibiotic biosynthesis monooxygenase (ABM) superfamily enzyme
MPTSFNSEYIVSVVAALLSAFLIQKGTPHMSPLIKFFLVPLLVAYVVVYLINWLMPGLNRTGHRISMYVENKTLGEINSMGYVQVFPPMLAILVIFFIMLYNHNLG